MTPLEIFQWKRLEMNAVESMLKKMLEIDEAPSAASTDHARSAQLNSPSIFGKLQNDQIRTLNVGRLAKHYLIEPPETLKRQLLSSAFNQT